MLWALAATVGILSGLIYLIISPDVSAKLAGTKDPNEDDDDDCEEPGESECEKAWRKRIKLCNKIADSKDRLCASRRKISYAQKQIHNLKLAARQVHMQSIYVTSNLSKELLDHHSSGQFTAAAQEQKMRASLNQKRPSCPCTGSQASAGASGQRKNSTPQNCGCKSGSQFSRQSQQQQRPRASSNISRPNCASKNGSQFPRQSQQQQPRAPPTTPQSNCPCRSSTQGRNGSFTKETYTRTEYNGNSYSSGNGQYGYSTPEMRSSDTSNETPSTQPSSDCITPDACSPACFSCLQKKETAEAEDRDYISDNFIITMEDYIEKLIESSPCKEMWKTQCCAGDKIKLKFFKPEEPSDAEMQELMSGVKKPPCPITEVKTTFADKWQDTELDKMIDVDVQTGPSIEELTDEIQMKKVTYIKKDFPFIDFRKLYGFKDKDDLDKEKEEGEEEEIDDDLLDLDDKAKFPYINFGKLYGFSGKESKCDKLRKRKLLKKKLKEMKMKMEEEELPETKRRFPYIDFGQLYGFKGKKDTKTKNKKKRQRKKFYDEEGEEEEEEEGVEEEGEEEEEEKEKSSRYPYLDLDIYGFKEKKKEKEKESDKGTKSKTKKSSGDKKAAVKKQPSQQGNEEGEDEGEESQFVKKVEEEETDTEKEEGEEMQGEESEIDEEEEEPDTTYKFDVVAMFTSFVNSILQSVLPEREDFPLQRVVVPKVVLDEEDEDDENQKTSKETQIAAAGSKPSVEGHVSEVEINNVVIDKEETDEERVIDTVNLEEPFAESSADFADKSIAYYIETVYDSPSSVLLSIKMAKDKKKKHRFNFHQDLKRKLNFVYRSSSDIITNVDQISKTEQYSNQHLMVKSFNEMSVAQISSSKTKNTLSYRNTTDAADIGNRCSIKKDENMVFKLQSKKSFVIIKDVQANDDGSRWKKPDVIDNENRLMTANNDHDQFIRMQLNHAIENRESLLKTMEDADKKTDANSIFVSPSLQAQMNNYYYNFDRGFKMSSGEHIQSRQENDICMKCRQENYMDVNSKRTFRLLNKPTNLSYFLGFPECTKKRKTTAKPLKRYVLNENKSNNKTTQQSKQNVVSKSTSNETVTLETSNNTREETQESQSDSLHDEIKLCCLDVPGDDTSTNNLSIEENTDYGLSSKSSVVIDVKSCSESHFVLLTEHGNYSVSNYDKLISDVVTKIVIQNFNGNPLHSLVPEFSDTNNDVVLPRQTEFTIKLPRVLFNKIIVINYRGRTKFLLEYKILKD